MAIDPPYRFDPWQNLVNVHWGVTYRDFEVAIYITSNGSPTPFGSSTGGDLPPDGFYANGTASIGAMTVIPYAGNLPGLSGLPSSKPSISLSPPCPVASGLVGPPINFPFGSYGVWDYPIGGGFIVNGTFFTNPLAGGFYYGGSEAERDLGISKAQIQQITPSTIQNGSDSLDFSGASYTPEGTFNDETWVFDSMFVEIDTSEPGTAWVILRFALSA